MLKKGVDSETHEDQGGIEIFVVLLHVLGVVFDRLSFVHSVEVKLGVVALDWLEERPQCLLNTAWN